MIRGFDGMFDVRKLMNQEEELSLDDDNETLIDKLIAAKRLLIADYHVVTTIEGLEAEEAGFYRRGPFVFYAPYVLFYRFRLRLRHCVIYLFYRSGPFLGAP